MYKLQLILISDKDQKQKRFWIPFYRRENGKKMDNFGDNRFLPHQPQGWMSSICRYLNAHKNLVRCKRCYWVGNSCLYKKYTQFLILKMYMECWDHLPNIWDLRTSNTQCRWSLWGKKYTKIVPCSIFSINFICFGINL